MRPQAMYMHSGGRIHPNYQLLVDAAKYTSFPNAFSARTSSRCRNNGITPLLTEDNTPDVPLMCLPRNPPRRPRLNRNLLLQTASTARRFRLRRKLLQRIHRDTILERRLIRGVEEDPATRPNFSADTRADGSTSNQRKENFPR